MENLSRIEMVKWAEIHDPLYHSYESQGYWAQGYWAQGYWAHGCRYEGGMIVRCWIVDW